MQIIWNKKRMKKKNKSTHYALSNNLVNWILRIEQMATAFGNR